MATGTLPDEVAERIRLEEAHRLRVRDELEDGAQARAAQASGPSNGAGGWRAAVWDFLNSNVGGWFLSSVLVGLAGIVWATVQDYVHRPEQAEAARRAHATQDVEMVTRLLPYLAKIGTVESQLAVAMIGRLQQDHAIDDTFAGALQGLLVNVTNANVTLSEDTRLTPETRAAARTVAEAAAKAVDSAPPTTGAKDRGAALSPARIYLQITKAEQRPRAQALQAIFREKGFLMPGIELLPDVKLEGTEVRYFNDEDKPKAEEALTLLKDHGFPSAQVKRSQLAARPGQLEIGSDAANRRERRPAAP